MDFSARLLTLSREAGFTGLGVAVRDFGSGRELGIEPERWFHAASTIKVAVLLAVFAAVDRGALRLDDPVHVRNRFRSVADGSVFRIARDRDADTASHTKIGRSMPVGALAHAMITRSSNLATNLLLEAVGLEAARGAIVAAGVEGGVRLVRGVEDHAAFEKGINNEVTAQGLVELFARIRGGDFVSLTAQQQMLKILLEQEFKSMLPARLPSWASVAHKTGEISTHCHDAGLVFVPNREPYAVAILTEGPAGLEDRRAAVAKISEAIFEEVAS